VMPGMASLLNSLLLINTSSLIPKPIKRAN
jgi:hypothetical protein